MGILYPLDVIKCIQNTQNVHDQENDNRYEIKKSIQFKLLHEEQCRMAHQLQNVKNNNAQGAEAIFLTFKQYIKKH